MSQIKNKHIANDAVTSTKIRLANNTYLRINDASGTAVNVLGMDASNNILLQSEATSGTSPNVTIATGNSSAGNSGNVVLAPGTATGTVGTVDLKAIMNLYGSNTPTTLSGTLEMNVPVNDTDVVLRLPRLGTTSYGFRMITADNNNADAVPTKTIQFQTGNKTAGTGDGGNIKFYCGTSVGGNRGFLQILARFVDLNGTGRIIGVVDPTGAQDAATKNYVDTNANLPVWRKFTFTFSSFSAAANTNSITLYNLPAQAMLHNIVVRNTASFTGTGITAYTVSVGISGNNTKYTQPFDVKQTPTAITFQTASSNNVESFGGAVTLTITATSTGATLDQATTGSVSVWIQSSTLV